MAELASPKLAQICSEADFISKGALFAADFGPNFASESPASWAAQAVALGLRGPAGGRVVQLSVHFARDRD